MLQAPTISIRDNNDTQIGVLFDYFNDSIELFLEGKVSVLTLSVLDENNYRELLEKGNSLSFTYDSEDYHMQIVKKDEDEDVITITAWSLVLELNNETKPAFKGSNMSFKQYLDAFDSEKILTLNVNEVSDKKITYEWESQQSMLQRIFSLAKVFSAEIEFNTVLDDDGSLKQIIVNVYREHDTQNQGLGKDRSSEVFYFGEDITTVKKTSDIMNLFTAIKPLGKDGINLNEYKTEPILDEKGEILFFFTNGMIYAPQAREKFPSNLINKQDKWIVFDWETEYATQTSLAGNALSKLKVLSQPQTEWTIEGYIKARIGDTISVNDDGYTPSLLLTARINSQKISMTNPSSNETTFSNVEQVQSEISDDLISRMNALIAENEKYELEVSTNNGVILKNGKGSTTLNVSVRKNGKDLTDSVKLKWFKDLVEFKNGKSLTVNAKDITVSLYRIEAWTDDVLRASVELTVSNIGETKIVRQDNPPSDDRNTVWIDSSKTLTDLDVAKIYNSSKDSWIAITPTNFSQIGAVSVNDFSDAMKIQAEMSSSIKELNSDVEQAKKDLVEYKDFKDGITQKVDEQEKKVTTVIKDTSDNKTNISTLTQSANELKSTISENKSDSDKKISQLTQTVDGFKQTVSQTYQQKGDYPTSSQVTSQINQKADSITSTISTDIAQSYSTKEETTKLLKDVDSKVLALGTNIAYNWSEDGTDRFTRIKPNENLLLQTSNLKQSDEGFWYGVRAELTKGTHPYYNNNQSLMYVLKNTTSRENYMFSKQITVKPDTAYRFTMLAFNNSSLIDANVFFLGSKTTKQPMDNSYDFVHQPINTKNFGIDRISVVTATFRTTKDEVGGVIRIDNNGTKNVDRSADIYMIEMSLSEDNGSTFYAPSPQDDYDNSTPRYIGRSLKNSDNPSDYTWEVNPDRKQWTGYKQGVNGEDFSVVPYGKNLFSGSELKDLNTFSEWLSAGSTSSLKDGVYTVTVGSIGQGGLNLLYKDKTLIKNATYTIGFMAKGSAKQDITYRVQKTDGTWTGWLSDYVIVKGKQLTDYFQWIGGQFKAPSFDYLTIQFAFYAQGSGLTGSITKPKLEPANTMGIPTPYTPSPSENLLATIPKYIGTAQLPYDDYKKYNWQLNPEWLRINTDDVVTQQYSKAEQTLDGFKDMVGKTYMTKDGMSGYYNKTQVDSVVQQKADSITSTVNKLQDGLGQNNLIIDSDFEIVPNPDWSIQTLPSGWYRTANGTSMYNGSYGLGMNITGVTTNRWSYVATNFITVGDNQVFSAKVMAKAYQDYKATSNDRCAMTIEFWDNSKRLLPVDINVDMNNEKWHELKIENVKVPDGTIKVRINFQCKRNGHVIFSQPMLVVGSSIGSYNNKSVSQSQIKQLSDSITSKVEKNGIISSINQSAESVSINASKINLQGAVTIASFATDAKNRLDSAFNTATSANNQINSWKKTGTTMIDGGNVYADSLSVINANLGTVTAGKMENKDDARSKVLFDIDNGKFFMQTVQKGSGSTRYDEIDLSNAILSSLKYFKSSSGSNLDGGSGGRIDGSSFQMFEFDGTDPNDLSKWTKITRFRPNGFYNFDKTYGVRSLSFVQDSIVLKPSSDNEGFAKNSGVELYGSATYIDFHDSIDDSRDYGARILYEDSTLLIVNDKTSNMFSFSKDGHTNFYTEGMWIHNKNGSGWAAIQAAGFNNMSSEKFKYNIKDLDNKYLNMFKDIKFKSYRQVSPRGNYQMGVILEENKSAPFTSENGVDLYSFATFTAKALQEEVAKREELEQRIEKLEKMIEERERVD